MDSSQDSPLELDLVTLTAGAVSAARKAGCFLREAQHSLDRSSIASKSAEVDLVSSADTEAERILRAELAKLLPSAGFIGEESELPDLSAHGYFWCVDPLDGTSNFLCGLPLWSVSIALVTPRFSPLLGVVHAPLLDRTWSAARGASAQCNGKAMHVRVQPPGGGLHNAMLATGFPYDVTTADEHTNLDYYDRMQRRFQKIRRLGSAAIDLAYVAEGTFDGMWELKLRPWDSAAGLLLIEEAGGLVCQVDGELYTPGDLTLVAASNEELLKLMLAILQGG